MAASDVSGIGSVIPAVGPNGDRIVRDHSLCLNETADIPEGVCVFVAFGAAGKGETAPTMGMSFPYLLIHRPGASGTQGGFSTRRLHGYARIWGQSRDRENPHRIEGREIKTDTDRDRDCEHGIKRNGLLRLARKADRPFAAFAGPPHPGSNLTLVSIK
jgi:hypothetical protein